MEFLVLPRLTSLCRLKPLHEIFNFHLFCQRDNEILVHVDNRINVNFTLTTSSNARVGPIGPGLQAKAFKYLPFHGLVCNSSANAFTILSMNELRELLALRPELRFGYKLSEMYPAR